METKRIIHVPDVREFLVKNSGEPLKDYKQLGNYDGMLIKILNKKHYIFVPNGETYETFGTRMKLGPLSGDDARYAWRTWFFWRENEFNCAVAKIEKTDQKLIPATRMVRINHEIADFQLSREPYKVYGIPKGSPLETGLKGIYEKGIGAFNFDRSMKEELEDLGIELIVEEHKN